MCAKSVPKWQGDDQLLSLLKEELFTAVVGDILDELGFHHQFLPANIKPLDPEMIVAGRAFPVLEADIFEAPDDPFGLAFRALDDENRTPPSP